MIYIRSLAEIENIGAACKIAARILKQLKSFVKPGLATIELQKKAEELFKKEGAEPAFQGYRGYPANICTSVNDAVLHGIPGPMRLKDGDIISIDVGAKYKGFYGDTALTVPVGTVKAEIKKLLDVAEKALYAAISKATECNRLCDISNAIQTYVEANNFSVVRDFVGHGIGTSIHEEPSIPNFGTKGTGPRLRNGMVLAIETMVNMGTHRVEILDDGWTVVTVDGKPAAHFEHTIAITKEGPRILTNG